VPCCNIAARVNAGLWAGTGAPYTYRSCGWKWGVYLAQGAVRLAQGAVRLAQGAVRLAQLPRGTKHPHIRANRAEWVSTGHGTAPRRRRS
jgi:X-X-X-Leu-X-X-Gly heptad repeat protein